MKFYFIKIKIRNVHNSNLFHSHLSIDSAPNHAATICQGPTLSLSATHASKICYSSNHIPYAIIQIKLRDIQKYDHDGKMANQVPRIKDPPLYVKKTTQAHVSLCT